MFTKDIWDFLTGNFETEKIQFEKIINKNRDLYGIGSFLEEERRMRQYTYTSYDLSHQPRYKDYVKELQIEVKKNFIFFLEMQRSKKAFV